MDVPPDKAPRQNADMNKIKEKLARGGTVFVLNPNFPSPALVEYAAELGFDAVLIDCEHGSADFERVEELARAARAGGMTSLVRPWSNEPGLVTRFLDCGVNGIQFPHVENAGVAREVVEMVRTARGKRFEDTLVVAMIESSTAAQNIAEIAAVGGIDAIVIGLADLADSLGHPGDGTHADVRRVVDAVITATKNSGRAAAGFNLHRWEEGGELTGKGVRWLTIHAKGMLARGAQQLHTLLGDTQRPR